MSKKLLQLKESFLSKQAQVETARKTLKSEFFGIDKAIDELVNNTRSWYVLNAYQDRPLIVNLWGLTGVGKTSLVTRLAELLSCQDRLFKFDLGDKHGSNSFRNNIDDICKNDENDPLIIVLDEFQHSRTLIGPMLRELASDDNRKIWELIDSGKIEYFNWYHGLNNLSDHVKKLKYFLLNGVEVEKGLIAKGLRLFNSEFHDNDPHSEQPNKTNMLFVDTCHYDDIMKFSGKSYAFNITQELKEHLLELNGEESVSFLLDIIKSAKKPQVKNFTKALIFVIGNLDEAYSMSANMSTDIDADVFYEASLKITVPQIKRALATRFRNEQIARLGNIHVIYPALSKKAFQNIIQHELEKVKQQTREHLDLELLFEESVTQLIYKEGVFPTQGVRPLLTTVNYLIKTNLPVYFSEILLRDLTVTQLKFVVKNKCLICHYISKNEVVHDKTMAIETPLEDIRISRKDDLQAITAVHESGHAIISSLLLKVIPDHVCSVTTETDANGFVFSKFPWKYVAKQDIIKRVAMYLGGYVAEELVFGQEHLTTGSSSDIQSATAFLSRMYKTEGLGGLLFHYNLDTSDNYVIHDVEAVELLIQEAMKKGYALAKETLEKEMPLLLVLSDYLSDHSSIEKEALKQKIQIHKISEVEFLDNNDDVYYRRHLKTMVSNDLIDSSNKTFEGICLNKNIDKNDKTC